MGSGHTEQRQDALRSELQHTREQIATFLRSGDQILTLLVTIVLGSIVALSASFSAPVAVVVPLGLLIPGLYAIRLNALIQHLGGYRKALEEQLNLNLSPPAYIWESTVAPLIKHPKKANAHGILAAVWLGAVALASASVIHEDWSAWWVAPVVAAYSLVALALAAGVRQGDDLFDDTYQIAVIALSSGAHSPGVSIDPSLVPPDDEEGTEGQQGDAEKALDGEALLVDAEPAEAVDDHSQG